MGRNLITGISSLALLAYFAWSMVDEFIIRPNAPSELPCELWLRSPEQRWLKLTGCVLDLDRLMLESEAGDFEPYSNRAKGISSKLYEKEPTWIAAWAPVRSPGGAGVVKAAYKISSPDVLKWLNQLERASEAQREKLAADPVPLRRIETPGLLQGHAEKPQGEALKKAFGTAASAAMLVVMPGAWPGPQVPPLGLAAGILGFVLGVLVLRLSTRSPRLDEPTASQLANTMSTSDVKLEIGALEELRREERKKK